MFDIQKLEELIRSDVLSPHNIQYHALAHFEQATEGRLDPVSNTSPFAALTTHSTVTASVLANEIADATRKISPEYADNLDELARHLPYKELTTIHGTPSETVFDLKLKMSDLLAFSVQQNPTVKQLMIPRGTVFTYLDDYAFGLHHDVLVTITNDDTIDARYLDNQNPLVALLNPIIEVGYHQLTRTDGSLGERYANFPLRVYQFAATTTEYPVTQSAPFVQEFELTDQYYHARVFNQDGGEWKELDTAFSEFIYDPNSATPVAVVRLLGTKLRVEIPAIYITRGIVNSAVRIQLYTTKGKVNLDLSRALMDNFRVEFINTVPANNALVAPLASFSDVLVGSVRDIVGGEDIPSFETQRQRVVDNVQDKQPITREQLNAKMGEKGYTVVHLSNYITENVYLGSKPLGKYNTGQVDVLYPGGTVPLYLSNLTGCHGVVANGSDFTITPDAIVMYNNNLGVLLSKGQAAALEAKADAALADELNKVTHLFSPFYYALEYRESSTGLYAYDLSSPRIESRDFVGVNPNAEGVISTRGVTVDKTNDGYTVVVDAACDSVFQDLEDAAIIAQLSLKAPDGAIYSINHTEVERTESSGFKFTFKLASTWALDSDYGIRFDNLDNNTLGPTFAAMVQTLNLSYNLVRNLPPTSDGVYKDYSAPGKLPDAYQTVSAETITIRFGTQLDELYRPVRSIKGETVFQLHEVDVMAYHTKDVFETDADGFIVFEDNPDWTEGGAEPPYLYKYKHRKGDPVLDENGQHAILHRAGTYVTDPVTKEPVVKEYKNSFIETSLVLLDYRFKVANANVDGIRDQLVQDIITDVTPINQEMLELSELYYSISSSCGVANVTYDSERSGAIPNELTFNLTVKLTKTNYGDAKFRETLEGNIKRTIAENLNTRTLAVNKLYKAIEDEVGSSVVGFTIDSIGGDADLVSFTLVNADDVVGVRGMLKIDASGNLVIGDGITIEFKIA